ncbi:hypothetical protein L484_002363 [Morus notabilis]|uniref:Uncharacterized protein n=1 Tax=Morus notabilis TaxID=981085 RepID=W9RY06_9ROSA|nr:hypothetical protein L484_002363 [Morus notabilis]
MIVESRPGCKGIGTVCQFVHLSRSRRTLNSLRIGHLHHKRLGWCCGSGSENARVSEHGVDSGFESLPVEGGDSVRGENMGSEGVSVGRGGLRSETVLVG